jgi:hypothetical protein
VNEAGTVRRGPFAPDAHTEALQVRELFQRARNARRNIIGSWKRNYKVLTNRAWAVQAEAWMPSPKITQVWPVSFSAVSWMTDQRPIIEVQPAAQPFSPYADFYQKVAGDMNTLLARGFQEYALDGEITKALWDVWTYGIGYFKTEWSPWLAEGMGDAIFARVEPFTFYPDPHATNMRNATYFVEAKTMTVTDLDRAFPGAARLIEGKYSSEQIDEAPHRLDESVGMATPRVRMGSVDGAATKWALSNQSRDRHTLFDEPVVTMLECWRRYHVVEKLDDGTSRVTDSWWLSVVVDDIVLMSVDASEVNAFGTHPYDRVVLTDTGEWYGPAMVEFLTSPQISINRTLANIEQNIALMGNPMLWEDPRAASRNHRISNRPGERIQARQNQVGWLQPPQMNPQIAVQLMSFYKGEIDSISGLSAMQRGFTPTGRNSEGVIDSVQDSAFVRVRSTLRELERGLRGVSLKMAATIAEFYTEARSLATIGPDGQKSTMALRARHFYTRDDDDDRQPLRFTVIADAGSQLPTSRQARAQEAERLFALEAIDELELLKAKQWPNYAVVAKRKMEQKAAGMSQPPGSRQRAGRNT